MSPTYVFECEVCQYESELDIPVSELKSNYKQFCDGCGRSTQYNRIYGGFGVGQIYGAGFSPSRQSVGRNK